MLFSMPASRFRCLFHACGVFHDFALFHFGPAVARFSKIFFFPAISSSLFWRVRFSPCGDRGRSLFQVPKGGLSLGALLPSHSRSSLLCRWPHLGSIPSFKRSPTTPSLFCTISHSARSPSLAPSHKIEMPHSEREHETSYNERSMIMRSIAPPSPLRPQRIPPFLLLF